MSRSLVYVPLAGVTGNLLAETTEVRVPSQLAPLHRRVGSKLPLVLFYPGESWRKDAADSSITSCYRLQGDGVRLRDFGSRRGPQRGSCLQHGPPALLQLRSLELHGQDADERRGRPVEVGRLLAQSRVRHGVLEAVPRHAGEGRRHTVHGDSAQQSGRPSGKPCISAASLSTRERKK